MKGGKSGKGRAEGKPKNSKTVTYACIIVIFFVLFSSLVLEIVQTVSLGGLVGSDVIFHYAIAREYSEGRNGLFSETALEVNGGPYPPLFHIMMALMIQFGLETPFAYLLQILGLPVMIGLITFIVYKKMGLRTAAMTAAIVFSSVAMLDRAQAIPQTLDMIFFPLAIYFFMEGRKWPYIICMLIPIYSHGLWALFFFGGLFLYSLVRKTNIRYNIWVLVLSLPLIIMTLIYLPGYLSVHGGGGVSSDQEIYASEPWFFMDYLGILIALVTIAFVIYLVVRSVREKRFAYRFTEFELICLFWLLSMLPLFFTIIDRFCSYGAPPLAILGAGFLVRVTLKKDAVFTGLLVLLAIVSFAYQALLLWAFLLERKHIFLSNILKNYGIIPV